MYVAGRAHWKITLDDPKVLRVALYIREIGALTPPTNPEIPLLEPGTDVWPVWARPRSVERPLTLSREERGSASIGWVRWWNHLLAVGATAWGELTDPRLTPFTATPELRRLLSHHLADAMEWATATADDPRFWRDLRAPGARLRSLVDGMEQERGRMARPFSLRVTTIPVAGKRVWRLGDDHLLVTHTLLHDDEIMVDWLRSVVRDLM